MEEHIKEIHKKHSDMLYRVAFSYVGNKSDAEDALQEVFIRFIKKKPVFENEEHERAWLIRVLVNICKDMLKSPWNNRTIGMDSISERDRQALVLPYGIQDETIGIVMALDERYRLPLYLFYYEGYAIREIAEILEIPESTVKTHLRRGREEVKKQLSEDKD